MQEQAYWIGRSRRNLKGIYRNEKDLLGMEQRLLRRILGMLFHRAVKGIVREPRVALRILLVAFIALFFVGIGYMMRTGRG